MAESVDEHRSRAKKVIGCAVITVSDTRVPATDESGKLICQLLETEGHHLVDYRIVRDEPDRIKALISQGVAHPDIDALILTGGTGISKRDRTYEAVQALLEKKLDGFGELFRYLSYKQVGSAALLSRATAGVTSGKVIFSLPGSKTAVELAMQKLILPEIGHLVSQAQKES